MSRAKIGSFANTKGGAGKTTTTVLVATTMVEYFSKKVLIIDADPHESLVMAKSQHEEEGRKMIVDVVGVSVGEDEIEYVHKKVPERAMYAAEYVLFKKVSRVMRDNVEKYDYIFFDMPGFDNEEIRATFAFSDFMIVTTGFNDMEMERTRRFVESIVNNIEKVKRDKGQYFRVFFLLTRLTMLKDVRENYQEKRKKYLGNIPNIGFGLSYRPSEYSWNGGLSLSESVVKGYKDHEVYKLTEMIIKKV
jgi:cellulose biosynthesis protein BcsQ